MFPGHDKHPVFRIQGIDLGNGAEAEQPILVIERFRLKAPVFLEKIGAGSDLAAPEIEQGKAAFDGAPHDFPVHEIVRREPPRCRRAAAVIGKNLVAKIAEIEIEIDPARLEQEIALLAQKADIDEELDRLGAHVNEVERVLRSDDQMGRRLDFLMQELNREANTLSSKSIVVETTRSAVDLKVLIEQMREQVQNIE